MEVSLKRPYDGSFDSMVGNKRGKLEQGSMLLSREDAMSIRQALRIIERQSNLQLSAAQGVDMSPSYASQFDNEKSLEGWDRNWGFHNQGWQGWGADQSLAHPSYIPTPQGTNYESRISERNPPPPLPITKQTVPNVPLNPLNYNFDELNSYDLPDQALEVPEPLTMEMRLDLDNEDLSRHSSLYLEDRQNVSDSGGDEHGSKKQHWTQFTSQEPEESGNTRGLVACIRCRQQRIKCKVNDSHPHGPCRTCTRIVNQKMYRLPCLRYKIRDTLLYREGNPPSLAWSQRWNNKSMIDVTEWESTETKFIGVSHGFCEDPIRLEVRKFVPNDGDVLERKWVDGQLRKTKRVEPYAILNMTRAAQEVRRYIFENVYSGLMKFLDNHDRLVRETYLLAYNHSKRSREEESTLLCDVLRLWFAIRHTTASEYLCGPETLGMSPERQDRSYPLFGEIPIAPVMGAQLELILTLVVLQPLRKKVLNQLQIMIKANSPKNWLAIYLSCFILLHSCSLATAWHYKYSRRNGIKTRYAMPAYIQELHQGANILLGHFHYCNKGSYPFSSKRNFPVLIAELNEDQLSFIVRTAEYFEARKEQSRKAKEYGLFEEEMYFVSQLFEDEWRPGPSV